MSKQTRKGATATPSSPKAKAPLAERIETFVQCRAALLALILIAAASVRIAATYNVFNHTFDEPAHIACGLQWLDQGIYEYEYQHPPLTRIMVALGPYLAGARSNRQNEMTIEGATILYGGSQYEKRLALSRAGNLPFFWLAAWMTFLWGRKILGAMGAVFAVLIFTLIPTVLAHSGLSTTDIGVTACFAAAAYATVRLVEEPSLRTGLWLGVALGLVILSKFSALVYYPVAAAFALAIWIYTAWPSWNGLKAIFVQRLPWLVAASILSFFVIWAGYRFSFGKAPGIYFRVPFPELYSGIKAVADHNHKGHLSYLLGELKMHGWWAFFPILLGVKLPLAMLGLLLAGLWRRPARGAADWPFYLAIAVPAAILAVAMAARINIGLRHILPAFPFLAVIAAAGAVWLLRSGSERRWALGIWPGALLWLCVSSVAAHPDYLAYFNLLAGDEPERIAVDSDLDWGQDIQRLGKRLQELNASFVTFTPTITSSLVAHGFPPHQNSDIESPAPGWNAVQLSEWKLYRMGLQMHKPNVKVWPSRIKPVERVGKSILLYYIPPRAPAR
jgi:hypothetical protein